MLAKPYGMTTLLAGAAPGACVPRPLRYLTPHLAGLALVAVVAPVAARAQVIQAQTVYVTPDGAYDPNRSKNSNGHVTTFAVINNTTAAVTMEFGCWATGNVTCTDITPTSGVVPAGGSRTLTVTYNVGVSGGQVWADAEGGAWYDTGHQIVTTPPTLTVVTPSVTQPPDLALVHTRTPLILATYSAPDATLDTTSLVVRLGGDTVTKLSRLNRGFGGMGGRPHAPTAAWCGERAVR